MSDPDLPSHPRPPPVPPGYQHPGRAPVPVQPLPYTNLPPQGPRTPFVLRMLIGFLGYILLSVGWFYLGVKTHLGGGVVWLGWLGMTGGLLGLSLYLRERYRFSGVGYGILSALLACCLLVAGVVLLVIGVCFSGNFRPN